MIDSKMKKKDDVRHNGNKIINILIIIVLTIMIQIPAAMSIIALPFSLKINDWYTIALSMLILGLTLFIVWAIRSYYLYRTYENQCHKMSMKDVFKNIGFFFLAIICSITSNALMFIFIGDSGTKNEKVIDESLDSLMDKSHLPHFSIVLVTILCLCFIGPYLEELIFRGIFKETLFMKSRFWLPLIISSVAFSSLHISTNIFSFGL